MRILVTGGAGFIGSHLVERYLAEGAQVAVLDDLSTGRRDNLLPHPALELVTGDVCDDALVDGLVARCDLVVHLAAAVGVQLVRERPLRAMRTNVRGVEVVLDAAARHGRPIVIASSSEVYGACEAIPFREDQTVQLGLPGELRSGYASAKAFAECAAFAYAAEQGLRVLVVRLFNTVGPRQRARYGMVLPRFVEQALAGEPLTVFGDGEQTRCFAHVGDVTRAIVALVRTRDAWGKVFNVGADRECRIVDLAERVRDVVASESEELAPRSSIARVPFELAHPGFGVGVRRRVPDLGRLREAIGAEFWQADLDTIIRAVVQERRSAHARDSRGRTRCSAPAS